MSSWPALVLGILLVFCVSARAQSPTALPGNVPSAGGTGLIVGQVVDAATGKPVSEAIVNLLQANAVGVAGVREMADADGRFVFSSLPAGRYNLQASKRGYLDARGLQRRAQGLPTPIDLVDGERLLNLKMTIWKYATVAGTVLDELGEPVVGIEVRALRRSILGGLPRFASLSSTTATTDDRGMYRIASLIPGEYVVGVPTSLTTFPVAAFDQMSAGPQSDPRERSEQSTAIAEISMPGMPRTEQIGDVAVLTLNRMPIPPAPTAAGVARVYPTVFYPGSMSIPEATVLSLKSGEERVAVNLQLKPVPAVRVSGTLAGPNGPIAKTALRLIPASVADSANEAGLETVTGLTDAKGAFTLMGVPAGQYLLKVLTPRPPGGAPTPPSTPDKPVLWAAEPVTVSDTAIDNLAIVLRPTFRISGRFEFEGNGPRPREDQLSGLTFNLDSAAGATGAIAAIDANATFVTGVPGGRYSTRAETPAGWRVKSVALNGNDATDGWLQLTSDSDLVFVLTDRPARLSGTVNDGSGAGDSEALVVMYPVNRDWWTGYGSFGWRVRGAQTSRTGTFSIIEIPAGEYFVTVLPDTAPDNWQDPKVLETLSRTATRVVIAEGDHKTIDLRPQVRR